VAFFAFEQVETIAPRPLLTIAGSRADTKYFGEEAIARAREPKELLAIGGATHIDLYDRLDYVPQVVTKLTAFYTEHLRRAPCRPLRRPAADGRLLGRAGCSGSRNARGP
jgi:hypothetical protein